MSRKSPTPMERAAKRAAKKKR